MPVLTRARDDRQRGIAVAAVPGWFDHVGCLHPQWGRDVQFEMLALEHVAERERPGVVAHQTAATFELNRLVANSHSSLGRGTVLDELGCSRNCPRENDDAAEDRENFHQDLRPGPLIYLSAAERTGSFLRPGCEPDSLLSAEGQW